MKGSGDFMPLDNTDEIDTGKPPPVLHTAHSSFLKMSENNWTRCRKNPASYSKLQKIQLREDLKILICFFCKKTQTDR